MDSAIPTPRTGIAEMNWTDERVEKLKKLWSEGLSASQIAAQLGGVSRNAVIGKVHRLSLPGRAKAGGNTTAAARPKRAASAPRAPNYAARSVTRTVTRTAGATALKEDVALDFAVDQEIVRDTNVVVPMSRRAGAHGTHRTHLQVADRRPAQGRVPFLRQRVSGSLSLLHLPRPACLPALSRAPAHALVLSRAG